MLIDELRNVEPITDDELQALGPLLQAAAEHIPGMADIVRDLQVQGTSECEDVGTAEYARAALNALGVPARVMGTRVGLVRPTTAGVAVQSHDGELVSDLAMAAGALEACAVHQRRDGHERSADVHRAAAERVRELYEHVGAWRHAERRLRPGDDRRAPLARLVAYLRRAS